MGLDFKALKQRTTGVLLMVLGALAFLRHWLLANDRSRYWGCPCWR
jgi:hypothetical protein